jgi:hypothetical protein
MRAVDEINRAFYPLSVRPSMDRLSDVARRPTLGPAAQVYLVNRVILDLPSSGDRTELLLLLIRNPSFSNAARDAIISRINEIGLDSHRVAVLNALADTKSGEF